MKTIIFLLIGIISSAHTFADDCDFLPRPAPEWLAALSDSVERIECKALTDKKVNQGRPLTIYQLELAREKLSENYQDRTLWNLGMQGPLNKKVDCMIATGDIKTCHCISSYLPALMPYSHYISIVTSTGLLKAEDYNLSESDFSKLTGMIWSIRDRCISNSQ